MHMLNQLELSIHVSENMQLQHQRTTASFVPVLPLHSASCLVMQLNTTQHDNSGSLTVLCMHRQQPGASAVDWATWCCCCT
jgi:hypothetical protein